jgi:hypothetical protein
MHQSEKQSTASPIDKSELTTNLTPEQGQFATVLGAVLSGRWIVEHAEQDIENPSAKLDY